MVSHKTQEKCKITLWVSCCSGLLCPRCPLEMTMLAAADVRTSLCLPSHRPPGSAGQRRNWRNWIDSREMWNFNTTSQHWIFTLHPPPSLCPHCPVSFSYKNISTKIQSFDVGYRQTLCRGPLLCVKRKGHNDQICKEYISRFFVSIVSPSEPASHSLQNCHW